MTGGQTVAAQFLGSEDPGLELELLVGPCTVKLDQGQRMERRPAETQILGDLERHELERVQVQGIEDRAREAESEHHWRWLLQSKIEVESAESMDEGTAPVEESSNLKACLQQLELELKLEQSYLGEDPVEKQLRLGLK